ncbi:MAG: sugar phosphate isomerase/epimerase [Sphingobacteriaceae bacterium]|nr:MAG: sugar phosphate isomerase/epimerase [Sphingobacteriaceae bacterium]
MRIEFFSPRWGSENILWNEFILQVKDAGFNGIEWAIGNDVKAQEIELVWKQAAKHNLLIIPQHYATFESDFDEHYTQYNQWLQKIEPFKPIKINSQTGKDFFTFEQNSALINVADEFTARTGIQVYHETHRNKFSFAAHITKAYLLALPALKLTFDVSHWINVAESYLADQQEAVELAIERTGHIHARVGYPEGPQISDPRAPEWKETVDIHLKLWKLIVRQMHRRQEELLTITPEFGPYPYLVTLPFTKQPIANQWDINLYMMQMLKEALTKDTVEV